MIIIKNRYSLIIAVLLFASFLGFFAGAIYDNRILKRDLGYWQLLYAKQLQNARTGPFVNGQPDLLKNNMFTQLRNQYISNKTSFITVYLRAMELEIFKNGEKIKTMKVISKGKEGSFRETPSGNYAVMLKMSNKFSSISKVWMPWSVQFYGNYYLHGLPYFPNGNLVTTKYSWGCIRLANEDAKEVYNFVEKGTPILISDDIDPLFTKKPNTISQTLPVPDISASSFNVFDFSSNEQLLGREEDNVLPIGYLTKLMTSLVASEVTNLENYIVFNEKKYLALDVLPYTFGETPKANSATRALVSVLGEKDFIVNERFKIDALMLNDTKILEPIGSTEENISSANDLTKLLGYILEKRKLITESSKDNPDSTYISLKGFLGGMTANDKIHSLTAWKLKNKDSDEFVIGITVLQSKDAYNDTIKLLEWVKKSYAIET